MKKILLGIILAILFTSSASAKSQKYGQKFSDWKVFTKEKAFKVTPYFHSGIQILEESMKAGYKLNLVPLNKGATLIQWVMNFDQFYAIYVEVYTRKGKRTLRYTSLDKDTGKKGGYINFGLGKYSRYSTHSQSGRVYGQTITRDLQKDLEKFEVGNKILAITSFMVRGGGTVYNIETADSLVSFKNDEIMFEAGNIKEQNHWSIFTTIKGTIRTTSPYITSRYRYDEQGIGLSGSGMKTGYSLSFLNLNDKFKTVGWDMRYSKNYAIYFLVNTSNGVKYLRYSSLDYDKGIHGQYISFGLGAMSKDGEWHSFRRNLQKDLNKFEPNSKLLSINAFMIRGSGIVDNIKAIKDSSVAPIENFDMNKFNELLKKNRENDFYGIKNSSLYNTSDEHIKYIQYTNQNGDYNWITFYTLSSDQTKLKALITLNYAQIINNPISNIKFNSEHTKMILHVYHRYNPNPDSDEGGEIYRYEVLL